MNKGGGEILYQDVAFFAPVLPHQPRPMNLPHRPDDSFVGRPCRADRIVAGGIAGRELNVMGRGGRAVGPRADAIS
jgi:hypothetical protein